MARSTGPLRAAAWLSAAVALGAGGPVTAQEVDAGLLPPSAVTDAPGLALAERVEAFYAEVHALRAHVTQRFHHRLHDRDVDAEGTLTARRPDRLRLLYTDGRGLAIEGTTYRAYEPEGAIEHTGEIPEEMLFDLLAVLSGTTRIRDAFDVRALVSASGEDVLELRPRRMTPRWDRALVAVAADGSIARILVVDPSGSWLRLVLTSVEYLGSIGSGELSLPSHDGTTTLSP